MLTESFVEKSFRSLFTGGQIDSDKFDEAEALLDELRPESPLRHRLSQELEELRELAAAKRA